MLAALAQRADISARVRSSAFLLKTKGLTDLLAYRPNDAHPYNPVELWRLYRDIRTRRPNYVLEFGCGCSTLIMAEALRRNGRGKLLTVDANPKWADVCRQGITPALAPFVSVVTSPVEVIDYKGEPAHRYTDVDIDQIDYLFLDGPSPRDVPGWQGQAVAADPVLLRDRFGPNARIVVEGRERNIDFLRRHLPDMNVSHHPPLRWVTFD